jgi:DNA invertase Pin-like site-specific DNA recombinase
MDKKTIIYIRTSTDEQNPENQLKDCQSLSNKEFEVLEDRQSAWKEHQERPSFEILKKLINKGRVENLIVWDLDRIYRSRKNLVDFFKLCEIKKCKINSFRQDWLNKINDMPTPWNEIIHDFMIQIMGWLAQDESDKKSQRVRAAIRIKDDGAYSYRGNKWGRKELSTQVINKVLELSKEGKSMREISREVKYSDKNNNMVNISKSAVHKILSGNHRKIKVNKESPQVDN